MQTLLLFLKLAIGIPAGYLATDCVMQNISYSFYKGDRQLKEIKYEPEAIQINDKLTGYGYNLKKDSDKIILFFGGSMYIAYNTVGMYAGNFDCPFLSVDYYGTQDSKGHMNLKTMKKSAEDLYDYAAARYAGKDVYIFGHSYGCGMAAYTASVRECRHLVLASGYRSSADMYNKIIPLFWGPAKIFITNNIRVDKYSKNTSCPVTVIGSDADKTLSAKLQKKLAACYKNADCQIFHGIAHEDYFVTEEVISFVKETILQRPQE